MNKRIKIVLAVLVMIIAVLIGWKVRAEFQKNETKTEFLTRTCEEADSIALQLDDLIADPDPESDKWDALSEAFDKLDKNYQSSGLDLYDPVIGFDMIGETLTDGQFEVNDITYYGILEDGEVSDSELQYLTGLRDDMETLRDALGTEGNINTSISVSQIDKAFITFFDSREDGDDNACSFLK